MRSSMTPEQLAALKTKSRHGNEIAALAQSANGHGVGRVDQQKADKALVDAVGKRKAAQLKEDALQRAGARPKGIRRWIG